MALILTTPAVVSAEETLPTRTAVPSAATELPPSFITNWGNVGAEGAPGVLNIPRGVAVAGGYVYVADTNNARIQKFTVNGAFVTQWGTWGSEVGEFLSPWRVAVAGGYLFVVDQGNHRVQKFTVNGAFVTEWGSLGGEPGEFVFPTAIAADGVGNVYVSDLGTNRVQRFTVNGAFVTQWGGDGETFNPHGLATAGGYVYVADVADDEIEKYTAGGAFVTAWGGPGSGDGEFSNPYDVAVDGLGNVYTAENRIQKFTSAGNYLTQWGEKGTDDGQFDNPYALVVDGGYVYVADTYNHRIQKFGDLADPTVDLVNPADGSNVVRTEMVTADYTCADEPGGSGIDTCVGTAPEGDPIDTSTLGDHDFTVTATDNAGNTTTVTHTYTVGPIPDDGFSDVPAWVDEPVQWLTYHSYATGYPDNTFQPNRSITRAQVANMLWGIEGSPPPGEGCGGLTDIPAWALDAICWLVNEGYATGYPDNTFQPNRSITRAQVANILWGIEGTPPPGDGCSGLTDVPDWARDAICWLVNEGHANGYPDNTFQPNWDITRAQVANMLYGIHT